MVYEGKAALIAVPKEANVEWGKAVGEWKVVQELPEEPPHVLRRCRRPQLPEQKAAFQQQLADARNEYADAFFDVNRCYVKANQHR